MTPLEGGCPCGALRYRLKREPLFVHACHCTRCQRETGGPFAHHALIERREFEVTKGSPEFNALPTDSGTRHWVARCPQCRTALWNAWGSLDRAVTLYVRVGTLDEPGRCPPRAHIFLRSAQAWLAAPPGAPGFKTWYDAKTLWPPASLERHALATTAAKGRRRQTGIKKAASARTDPESP